jgi:subtilisin-like proprotein convertase family protein
MKRFKRSYQGIVLSLIGVALPVFFFLQGSNAQRNKVIDDPKQTLSQSALQQIQSLLDDKENRSMEQKKISSSLLYKMKETRGERLTNVVTSLRSQVEIDKGFVLVDIKCKVSKSLITMIEELNGKIVYSSERAGSIRARLPLRSLEKLAGNSDVSFIRPAVKASTQSLRGPRTTTQPLTVAGPATSVRDYLSGAIGKLVGKSSKDDSQAPALQTGSITSQGDVTHRAAEARNFFGVNGAGVKIGVLSDSVDFLDQSIASGNLPTNVTVLPGQDGVDLPDVNTNGEGTAMLEIIHDLAPGARLFFATGFISPESFADNIRALRAAGCDIIVDDIVYANESPFHIDTIATAVEEVTNDGALYFSSAGNYGNFNDGTSSVWEGDFKDSGVRLSTLPGGGTLHDFGSGVISNRVEQAGFFALLLYWSDMLGASSNDYDLFIMDPSLTNVVGASTEIQDGDDDPFELTFGAFPNERIVIFKKDGAEKRALHLNNFAGELSISTPGSTHGHSSVARAFSVAATPAGPATGGGGLVGPFPNPFNSLNMIEPFSSDGPRRIFYNSDGTAITPGNLLFSNNGGQLITKPDLTAADGVSTSVPTFDPFFGTSAAAPHAAAIAALIKSARPNMSQNKIRSALTQSVVDIEAAGRDRDSGFGIIDAFRVLDFIGAAPAPLLELSTQTVTPVGGDGDAFIEPGEAGTISVRLTNVGGATALTPNAMLTTSTPGVTITTATSTYPNIGSNGGSATNNTLFRFNLASTATCGLFIRFSLRVTYPNPNSLPSPQVFDFSVATGQSGTGETAVSYTGPPTAIPDNDPNGVSIPIVVSGATGGISNVKFSFDGTLCTSAAGATTVGLDHTWVGDVVVTLTSPHGTTITLMNRPGEGMFTVSNGNNFCNTVLDDAATNPIQGIDPVGAPYTGLFKPANPLSILKGENPNGVWTLKVVDAAEFDTGSVRAFSLRFTTFQCN